MADNYLYSAALVGGPPWGFRVACAADPLDANYAVQVAQVCASSGFGSHGLTFRPRDLQRVYLLPVKGHISNSNNIFFDPPSFRLALRFERTCWRSSLSPQKDCSFLAPYARVLKEKRFSNSSSERRCFYDIIFQR